jgi:NagD protein
MYFIDVQGTLISDIDKTPIDGAIEFIDLLNSKKIPYMIITNNTKKSSKKFREFLVNSGFNIPQNSYLDPLMIIKETLVSKRVAAYGHDEFIQTLKELGYEIDFDSPQAVVVGIKKDFMSYEYSQMIEAVLNGADLVGMHESTLYATNSKRYPGVGAIMKMLSFATGADYTIVGKPSFAFYKRAKEMIGVQNYHDITIISDDVKGDLVGAKELGMRSIFVLSGKYKNANEIIPTIANNLRPDRIIKSIKEVVA